MPLADPDFTLDDFRIQFFVYFPRWFDLYRQYDASDAAWWISSEKDPKFLVRQMFVQAHKEVRATHSNHTFAH